MHITTTPVKTLMKTAFIFVVNFSVKCVFFGKVFALTGG